eukprot:jgi/Ulvmu1/7488/UM037_0032.1
MLSNLELLTAAQAQTCHSGDAGAGAGATFSSLTVDASLGSLDISGRPQPPEGMRLAQVTEEDVDVVPVFKGVMVSSSGRISFGRASCGESAPTNSEGGASAHLASSLMEEDSPTVTKPASHRQAPEWLLTGEMPTQAASHVPCTDGLTDDKRTAAAPDETSHNTSCTAVDSCPEKRAGFWRRAFMLRPCMSATKLKAIKKRNGEGSGIPKRA